MKHVNETYFPRDGPKKKLVIKNSYRFKKDKRNPSKRVMKKKTTEKIVNQEPKKLEMNKIENLSFTTLTEGMLVVGCVREVCPHHVSVMLLGGILAQLPITSISPTYTQAVQELTQQKITKDDCLPLSELFQIGETLSCRVSTIKESGKLNPYVYVSISPVDVNNGRSHATAKVGDLLIAAVESREDHGYIMSTGINGLTAFLKNIETVKYVEERNGNRPLAIGQVVKCIITKVVGSALSTVVELTANPDVVSKSVLKPGIIVEKLVPMARTNVIVKNVQPDGLEVKVLGCSADILSYIESSHLESCWSEPDNYLPGSKLTATVLCIEEPLKTVFFSLKKVLTGIIEQKLKNGAVIDNAKVTAITEEGIYIIIGKKEDELKGFISLRHIDGPLGPEELPLKHPVGTELQTRIIDFDPIQQIYTCSAERSFINEKYVTVSDVHVNDIVDCTVKELEPTGVHLSLGRLSVFAPAIHVSDVPVKNIKTKVSIGKHVKARVLSVDELSNRVCVTLKPTLLNCKPLVSYKEAHKGDQYYGVISSVCESGLYVSFYNEVCGFLPREFMDYAADVVRDFVQGQLVKCYIVDVDCNKKKLTLGFTDKKNQLDQSTPSNSIQTVEEGIGPVDTPNTVDVKIERKACKFVKRLAAFVQKQDYKTGTKLTGKVTGTADDGIHLKFKDGVKGVLCGHPHNEVTFAQDIEVMTLWQDPGTKLLYLQPVGTFLDDQKVKLRSNIIGSHVTGRVLFSNHLMAICVLTGESPLTKHLAYIPRLTSVLQPESELSLCVQNVIDDYIICAVREDLIKMYKGCKLKVPENILNTPPSKTKGQCGKEMGPFNVDANEQDKGESSVLESNKQNKRKNEELFTEFSVIHKKIKNNSLVPDKDIMKNVNVESKEKKKKKKEIAKVGDANDMYAEDVGMLKNKKTKNTKKSASNGQENSVRESENKESDLVSVESMKPVVKNKNKNKHILNVDKQESCEGISETNKSIQSDELLSRKKIEREERELKFKSKNSTLSDIGFFWDAKPEDLMGTLDETAETHDSDEDEEESTQKSKSKSRMTAAEKREAAKEAELKLREKEAELLRAEVNPQSADQFDRALLSNPECAELWIKYMAYHLQATEIEKARSVARRALQTMSYRSEGERLNVWIALLNLENMYGTQESLKETLNEALRTNDDYLVYSRMLEIYVNSNKSNDAEQLVNVMLRKFRESEDCWLHCCTSLMNCGLHDKARNLLQRALSSLQSKSHVNLISKFALLENKHGFREKAVTLLENVLITYPGRVDIWSVYVDMLIKSEDIKQARQVLERAANQNLPARKMKSIYSKWLSFEEKFGDENSVQHVKKAALHYVNTITKKLE